MQCSGDKSCCIILNFGLPGCRILKEISITGSQYYFDCKGTSLHITLSERLFSNCKRTLKKGGSYLTSDIAKILRSYFQMLWTSLFCNKRVWTGASKSNLERLNFLKEPIVAGGRPYWHQHQTSHTADNYEK